MDSISQKHPKRRPKRIYAANGGGMLHTNIPAVVVKPVALLFSRCKTVGIYRSEEMAQTPPHPTPGG